MEDPEEAKGPLKRPKLDSADDGVIDLETSDDGHLDEDVQLEQELREAQADLDKIHEEMLAKLREVEQEYEAKKVPFYHARGEVIKNIPGFWLHCFLQHQEIKLIIGEVDQEILSLLTEITVESHDDPKEGYKLLFSFAENSWFEDKVLVKDIKFTFDSEQGIQQCHTQGTKPKWKSKDPTAEDPSGQRPESATFISWLTSDRELEPGLVDTLSDIVKDQLFVNPLEYLDAENHSEGARELEGIDVEDLDEEGEQLEDPEDLSEIEEEEALDEAEGSQEGQQGEEGGDEEFPEAEGDEEGQEPGEGGDEGEEQAEE